MKNEWLDTTLGEFVTLQRGHDLTEEDRIFGNIPVMGSSGISGYHNESKAKGPGVTIGRSGVGSMGVVSYCEVDYWPHNTVLYVTDFHSNDPKFVYYFLKSLNLRSYDSGSAQASLNRNFIYPIEIHVPSLPEQRAIAHILGTLDDKIELNRRMNETLEAIARSIFKAWFVDSIAGGLPDGWKVGSILEFADLLSGGTPRTSVAEYWDGQIPWVSAKDVSNTKGLFLMETEKTISKAGLENSSTKLLPKNTTVVTARGTVGAYCLLSRDMTMNQTNYGLKAKEGIGDYFVFFSLATLVEQLKQHAYGTIFDTITTKTFEGALAIQPPNDLIIEFENRVTPLMEKILSNQEESSTLATMRDALLPKLLSGEVKANNG